MAEREFLSEELNEFEHVLSALSPRSSSIDRDRLLFLAGQASVAQSQPQTPHRTRLWQFTTAISSTVAVVLGTMLAVRAEPEVVREMQYVERDVTESSELDAPDQSLSMENSLAHLEFSSTSYVPFSSEWSSRPHYLQMREVALRQGLDAMASLTPDRTRNSQNQKIPTAPFTHWRGLLLLREHNQNNSLDNEATPDLFDESTLNFRGEQL